MCVLRYGWQTLNAIDDHMAEFDTEAAERGAYCTGFSFFVQI